MPRVLFDLIKSAAYYHYYQDVAVSGSGTVRVINETTDQTMFEVRLEEGEIMKFTRIIKWDNYHDTLRANDTVFFSGGRVQGKLVVEHEPTQTVGLSEYRFVDH